MPRAKKSSFVTYLEFVGREDVEVEVEYNFTPGSPGCMYRSNGDPGDPPEPPEVEILSVWDTENDCDISDRLSPKVMESLEEQAMNDTGDEDDDDCDDRDDDWEREADDDLPPDDDDPF